MRNLFGLETEYGLIVTATGLSVEEAAKRLFAPIQREYGSTSAFLDNGGRLYLDVGAHPEYATAECTTGYDLLVQDAVGWQKLENLVERLNGAIASEYAGKECPKVYLIRNNIDSVGNSCGCHENFLLPRTLNAQFQGQAASLLPVLVLRTLVTGAGHLTNQGRYLLSSRAHLLEQAFSAHSGEERPLINTRDEPLADTRLYRRLHVISSDTNISQPATLMKVSLLAATITSLTSGFDFSAWQLAHPVQALRDLAADPSGQAILQLAGGTTGTAHRLLASLIEELMNHLQTRGLLCELQEAFRCSGFDPFAAWLAACDYETWAAGSGLLRGVMDWQIKLNLLESVRAKRGLNWDDVALRRVELAYHQQGASGLDLEAAGLRRRLISPEEIMRQEHEPPVNTRAKLRSDVLKAASKRGVEANVDWLHMRVNGTQVGTLTLTDPFATHDDKVEQLLAQLA